MIEALSFGFIQNAIIAGLLVSIMAGIIGSLIVVNRMVFLAGGIAHTTYGGIGFSVFFALPIFFGASLFAILAALIMSYLTIKHRERTDTMIGLIWAVGMAIGIILIDLTPGYSVDLMSYLFGSILAVSSDDIIFMSILLVITILAIFVWYKQILAVSYDSEYASLNGTNVPFFYTIILVLSALTIVVAIKAVGLILVIALLTIPVYIAERVSKNLLRMMITSSIISSIFMIVGLIVSYQFNISTGATIILVSAISMICFMFIMKFKK